MYAHIYIYIHIYLYIYTHTYITELLCCIPETNTILLINYTPIKLNSKKEAFGTPDFSTTLSIELETQ